MVNDEWDLLFYAKEKILKVKMYLDKYNERKLFEEDLKLSKINQLQDKDALDFKINDLKIFITDTLSIHYDPDLIIKAISILDRVDRIFWKENNKI